MSSAQPIPQADLPGAGVVLAPVPIVSTPAAPVATSNSISIIIPTGAAAGESPDVPIASPVSHISSVPTALSPTTISSSHVPSQSGIILPSGAISITPPHLISPSDQAGPSGANRILTVAAITQGSRTETGSLALAATSSTSSSLQPGVSSAQVLTVEIQGSSSSVFSTLVTASPQSTQPAVIPSSLSPSAIFSPAGPLPSSVVPIERLEMNQTSPQTTNIFNPENKLFPLGVAAVSVAGVFIAIFVAFLIIRCTGCTRGRNRYDKRLALPSMVEIRDDTSSFHDRSPYSDDAPIYPSSHRLDIEKNAFAPLGGAGGQASGDGRYPTYGTLGQPGQRDSRGWDTSHIPSSGRAGIASTGMARQDGHTDSGYTAYEQIFFPTPSRTSPPASRALTPPGLSYLAGLNSWPYAIDTRAALRGPRDSALVRLGKTSDSNGDGSAVNPFFPPPRSDLILANPDLSRQGTPLPTSSLPVSPHPAVVGLPKPTTAKHIQYDGFQPRTLRNSVSTISSFNSGTSSLSAYSDMTRAQMPAFKFDAPMPAFMGGAGARLQGGTGVRLGAERDRGGRVESLDVPKDAVSRPGSGNVGFSGERSGY